MTRKITLFPLILLFLLFFSASFNIADAQSTILSEGFDVAPPANWVIVNNSSPLGTLSWFQGQPGSIADNDFTFDAENGATDSSYIAVNYNSVDNIGTISDWLITPTLVLKNGGVLSFWTRTVNGSQYPDRLEVRMNTTDSSTNVGTAATDVGNFTDSLLSINSNLVFGGYPDTGWVNYTITLSGLSGIDTGRFAFRYYVTDGGENGANSNYIGIDNVTYTAGVFPVTFLSFNGVLENNIAVLNWSTTNEINNKGFDVEKSADGQTFTDIGFVAGHGNMRGINNYTFSDPKLISGNNYYRLKQIDFDGNSMYSPIIKLEFNNFAWSILGNPSSNSSVQLQLDKQYNIALQVISLSGTVIQTINKGNLNQGTYSIPIDLSRAASGMYIVRLIASGENFSKKIIK